MITTNQFVFIHMHKTGGQSLNHIIAQCMKSFQSVGYHYPHHMLPTQYSELPVVGIVRNPWDWYVSWYAFNTRPNCDSSLFFIVSDGGRAGFKETIKNLISLGSDSNKSQQYRNALVSMLPDSLEGNQGVGLTKDCIRHFSDNNTGYYTWLFNRMHGNTNSDKTLIGRFENLQDDFLSIMETLAVKESDAMKSEFDKTPRRNASKHDHYSCYFDDELRDLVAQKEGSLIENFNYMFDDRRATNEKMELPLSQRHASPKPFYKLLGKEPNFLQLHSSFDIQAIKNKLAQIPDTTWGESGRENRFEVHKQTQALLLIHDDDFRHSNPTHRNLYNEFKEELKPLIDFVANYYQHNGSVVRLLFAKLQGGGKIPAHIDDLYSLVNCHRIHIPIISNDQNVFTVGGEQKVLREGEIWEINNSTVHAVSNDSDKDRIHIILDWVPDDTINEENAAHGPAKIKIVTETAAPKYDGKRVSRNSPCPCNSGKKFKQCHGALQ